MAHATCKRTISLRFFVLISFLNLLTEGHQRTLGHASVFTQKCQCSSHSECWWDQQAYLLTLKTQLGHLCKQKKLGDL